MTRRVCCLVFLWFVQTALTAADFGWVGTNSLSMPQVGAHGLRILTPNLLELSLVNTKKDEASPVSQWDFIGPNFTPKLPAASEFKVTVGGKQVGVRAVDFKRRPLYAPLKARDLRILNQLYLHLSATLEPSAKVQVANTGAKLWKDPQRFEAVVDPLRFSPAIHVNQAGYAPDWPKRAMVGYYLGTGAELKITATEFSLIDSAGKEVFQGKLRRRMDKGFAYSPTPYQNVHEADFSEFKSPGIYRLKIDGMGASYPFRIEDGVSAIFARAYALGLYHQRCGTNNALPFTRHTHDACHVAPAEVLTKAHKNAQSVIAEVSSGAKDDPRHVAPQLKHSDASLYPFVRRGKVDVRGGHHDAGDYSKYTINSAGLIHSLVFAADNFEGAGALDNLGLPESGDGKSDLLQEAKWEADFLARMQDDDGGFYFLVYPRDRRYEDNVLPDKGDPQIVWPKTTSATAAAVAALAEIGSSPIFKKQFPQEAAKYLEKANKGWGFLEKAIAKHGRDGAYQVLTHYGHEFFHDDELGWAAAAMFAATGRKEFEQRFVTAFNPEDTKTRRWSWWPMFEGWGNATRTYVFARRNGRLREGQANADFLTRCETLIRTTAMNHVRFAQETAYGTSFPDPNKANKNAGWYFSAERAFDIAVALSLRSSSAADPAEAAMLDAIVGNVSYEAGCNPLNVSFLTGIGARRQREIVHQYAQNDHRILPPSGIPLGNIQGGFPYLHHYKKELGALPYPPDGAETAPYPFYDRWGDTFNTTTEFVVVDLGRSLGTTAFLMARSSVKNQPWRAAAASIVGVTSEGSVGQPVRVSLKAEGIGPNDMLDAQIVWEARDQEPVIAREFAFTPKNVGEQWIEAEAMLKDGRRVFAKTSFTAGASKNTPANAFFSRELEPREALLALFNLNNSLEDSAEKAATLRLAGNAAHDSGNLSWMAQREGGALRFKDLGDKATTTVPVGPIDENVTALSLQAMLYINSYKAYNKGNAKILSLGEEWNSTLEFIENMYEGPMIKGGTKLSVEKSTLTNALPTGQWHHLEISLTKSNYTVRVNGKPVKSVPSTELQNWGRKPATLELGNFDGYIDAVAVSLARSAGADDM